LYQSSAADQVTPARLRFVIDSFRVSHLGLLYGAADRGDVPDDADAVYPRSDYRHHAGFSGGRVDSRLIGQLTDLISGDRLPCTHRRHYPNLDSRQTAYGHSRIERNVRRQAPMAYNGRAPHHLTIRTLCWRGPLIETGIGMKRWDANCAGAGWSAAVIRERRTCWTSRIAEGTHR
jgi:hypothetical protein